MSHCLISFPSCILPISSTSIEMHLKSKTIHRFFPTHCLKSLVVFKYFSSPDIAWLLILFLILLFNAWQDKPFPFQSTISATNQ